MRPIPIPDDKIGAAMRRVVIGAPNGDLLDTSIAPVEALVYRLPDTGERVISVLLGVEEGDLEKLARGGLVWLTFIGGIPPFDVHIEE